MKKFDEWETISDPVLYKKTCINDVLLILLAILMLCACYAGCVLVWKWQ